MFTGVIRDLGTVKELRRLSLSYQLVVENKTLNNVQLGDSIAINGVCLTVTTVEESNYSFDLSFETIKKTAFATVKAGSVVHLEPALKIGSSIDGHLVQGHVDCTGKIARMIRRDQAYEIEVAVAPEYNPFLVPTGSVAVNGVSLTMTQMRSGTFTLVIVPHSFKETTFSALRQGDFVNIEFDFIAKYLYHFKKFPKLEV